MRKSEENRFRVGDHVRVHSESPTRGGHRFGEIGIIVGIEGFRAEVKIPGLTPFFVHFDNLEPTTERHQLEH